MICYLSASEHLAAKEKFSRYSVFMFVHQLNRSLLIVCRQPSHNISSLSLEKKKKTVYKSYFYFHFKPTMKHYVFLKHCIGSKNSLEFHWGCLWRCYNWYRQKHVIYSQNLGLFPNIVRCSSRSEIFLELGDGIWDYYYLRLKFGDRQSKFGHKILTSLHEVHSI